MAITISSSIRQWSVLFLALLSSSNVDALRARAYGSTDLSTYHVPLSNGSASLPPPEPPLTLKAITIGRGTQNYTCAPNSIAAPVSVGAVAELFDAISLSQALWVSINDAPRFAINLDLSGIEHLTPKIGNHFFDAAGVPTFDLGSVVGLFKGKRDAAIAAPPDAVKGPGGIGDGAIDWLALSAVAGSVKLQKAYRVETAGGKAPSSCAGQPPLIKVQYAAAYWFYG